MRTIGPADNEPAGGRGVSSRRTGAWIGDGATMRSAVQAMKASPNAAERRIRFVARRMFFESEPMSVCDQRRPRGQGTYDMESYRIRSPAQTFVVTSSARLVTSWSRTPWHG